MYREKMCGYQVLSICMMWIWMGISQIYAQPTVIDFDYCQESANVRQISSTLEILTRQTKALSVSVQQMQETVSETSAKFTTTTEVLGQQLIQVTKSISKTMNDMSNTINDKVQKVTDDMDSVLSEKLSKVQEIVLQALSNQSAGISNLFALWRNSTSGAEFDPDGFMEEIERVLNNSIMNPFNSVMDSNLSTVDSVTTALDRFVTDMQQNMAATGETVRQEVGKVRDQLGLVLSQTTRGLLQELNNRTLSTEVGISGTETGSDSAIDNIISLIKIREKEQSANTKQIVLEISTALKEAILVGLSNNRQSLSELLSRANISGGLDAIRQTISSEQICPVKAITDTIKGTMHLQTGILRLVNSTNPTNGRVEVLYRGEWGTICDDDFGSSDAQVICRQLGWCGGEAKLGGVFGKAASDVPIHLDDMGCRGSESNILQCTHSGLGTHNCGHSEDVGVSCRVC